MAFFPVRLWKGLLLTGCGLLSSYVWGPLLLLYLTAAPLSAQEQDARQLLRHAPLTAWVGVVQVSGPAKQWSGRYLSRALPVQAIFSRLTAQGFVQTEQLGAQRTFTRSQESVTTLCRMFSRGFLACTVRQQGGT